MHILDLPLEEQKRIAIECGYIGEEGFQKFLEEMRKNKAWIEQLEKEEVENPPKTFLTEEEAEELINDILTNPEDKVGFAKRMAVDPDLVTAEKMIERIRAKVRK